MTLETLQVQERQHRRLYERAKLTFIVIGTVTSLVVLGVLMGAVANLQHLSEATNKSTNLLVDCTTPEGKCYRDGDRRSGAAVQTINKVSVLAAYCSKQPGNKTVPQIEACITKELDSAQK